MIDHVSIGVADTARAKRFYDAALKPLGYKCLSEGPGSLGYGRDGVVFWISETAHPVEPNPKSGLHFCFAAPTPASVDAFHAAAIKNHGFYSLFLSTLGNQVADRFSRFAIPGFLQFALQLWIERARRDQSLC